MPKILGGSFGMHVYHAGFIGLDGTEEKTEKLDIHRLLRHDEPIIHPRSQVLTHNTNKLSNLYAQITNHR